MNAVGIICEYNPFHNGHLYHLNEVKKMYKDSIVVLVLGSYFLERGDVSLISKWNKTKLALEYGVDLVLELPTLYNTNSADYFAYHAVKALNEAKVQAIVFGSETNDIELLNSIALEQKNEDFNVEVKKNLKRGCNYPTSLSESLGITLDSNDLLGVSYIKAINEINSNIKAVSIKRTNSFNDLESDEEIVSASNIREKLRNGSSIEKYIPSYDISFINEIDEDKLLQLISHRIITEKSLDRFLGVDEGIENKLKKEIGKSHNLDELIERVKSKRYTRVRIKRMLVHILLGIEKSDMQEVSDKVKILGFNSRGREYLKEIKNENLVYKLDTRSNDIERIASFIYYELTHDESSKNEILNKPIQM